MRTEIELWKALLTRQDLFSSGLCTWIFKAPTDGTELLTIKEAVNLYEILRKKREEAGDINAYWVGARGDLKARINWIENRIKELGYEAG